ncbi:MAG TPA: glycosyltransferase 87 family protein [Acidimicrobiales bacterium]|nr:glycosyltransferase 87 family protein [Acidimicrobiales bacterium]
MAGAVTAHPRSPPRPNRAAPLPYLVAGLAGAGIVAYLIIWGRRYGLDLKVYRGSVQAWHRGLNPYDGTYTASRLDFTYPPFALLVLSALAWGSFAVTQWLLWAVSIAAATASVVIVLRDRGVAGGSRLWCASFAWTGAAVLVLEPARSGLDYGQIEFVLMFLVVADLLAIPAPFRGVVVGVASAIKLTPLVFLIVLLTRRDWASTVRALVSFVVWTAFTWLLWPAESRVFWRNDVIQTSRVGNVTDPSNQSWNAVVHRPPFPATGSTAVWLLLSGLTLVIATVIAWRCTRTGRQAFAVIAIAFAGLLVSPISWSHHWVWVLLVPPLLIGPRRLAVPGPVRLMFWGLVVLTVAGPYWWWSGTLREALDAILPLWTFALLSVWAALELIAWRTADGRRTTVTTPSCG